MSREFLPGNCVTDEHHETFEQIDDGESTPALLAIAKTICESCVQRAYCEDQRSFVAVELAKQGVESATTMIGSVEVSMEDAHAALAKQSALERLREPAFQFDIQHLPDDFTPRQILQSIRQAMRARQIRVEGRPPNHKEAMESRLQTEPLLTELDSLTAQEIVETGAAIVLRHRAYNITQHRKSKPLTNEEIERASDVFHEFTKDSLVLATLGVKPRFAQYHDPALYPRLVTEASRNNLVTPAIARDIVRSYASDPVAALERRTSASAAVSTHQLLKHIPPELHRYRREVSQRHSDPRAALDALRKRFSQLVTAHPDLGREALAYISYHYPDSIEKATQEYCAALLHTQEFSDHPYFTPHILSSIALKHLSKTPDALRDHINRAEQMCQIAKAAHIDVDNTFLGYTALATNRVLDAAELNRRYLARCVTHKSSSNHPLLNKGIAVRSAEVITDDAEREYALICASNLVRRGLMRPQGAALEWTAEADYLHDHEKLAVLYIASLDEVLGNSANPTELTRSLQCDDLDALVNQVLVPYLSPPKDIYEDILHYLRYRQCNRLTHFRSTAVRRRLEKLYDYLGEDDPTASYPNRYIQTLAPLTRIADAYPTQWPAKAAILEAIDTLSDDYLKIDFGASYGDPNHRAMLMAHTGNTPRTTKRLYHHALVNGVLPLRYFRTMLGRIDDFSAVEGASELSDTQFTELLAYSKDTFADKLATMNRLIDHFQTDLWLNPGLIRNVTIKYKDPESQLVAISRKARSLHAEFHDFLDRSEIVYIIHTNKEPDSAVANIVNVMRELENKYPDDPTLSRFVLYSAAQNKAPEEWLGRYRKRYKAALAIARSDATPDSIKRIAVLNHDPTKLQQSIQTYSQICEEYRYDDYIERWMIDDALRWSSRQFRSDLTKLRHLLMKGLKTASYSLDHEDDKARVLSIEKEGSQPSSEATYHNERARHEQREAIILMLSRLSPLERAAVAHAYSVESGDADELTLDDVYAEFNVASQRELLTIVNSSILPKIKES